MASSAPTPLSKIEQAHQMYRDGLYTEALGFYTEALSMAKTNHQKIALHSNRAACFLKLHDFKKAAQECTSVLELDHNHTGALMLRAQTLVTLKEYHSALFDVNRLIELNPDSEAYQNLQARLKTQLSLATIHESEAELEEEEEEEKGNNKRENAIPVIVQNLKAEPKIFKTPEKANSGRENSIPFIVQNLKAEPKVFKTLDIKKSSDLGKDQKAEPKRANAPEHSGKESSAQDSKGWQAIPKPKGHSALNYARWDRVEDDSSEDDDDDDGEDDEDSQPQYRFRVKTVGVRPVK